MANIYTACENHLKGQSHEVFCFRFFMNHHSTPRITWGSFKIFSKILGDICKWRSTTSIDNSGKFCLRYPWCCWYRWQILGTISNCWHLKVILKEKMYLYDISTTQRCSKKIIKTFLIEDFFICHRCQRHRWCTLSCTNFRKIWNGPNSILRGLGESDS